MISGAQQSNLRPVHTNISITVTDSGFARERKPDTPISFPRKLSPIYIWASFFFHGIEVKITQLVSDMHCQWAWRLSLLLLDHTSLKQVTAHTSHLTAASLWLPPSGTGMQQPVKSCGTVLGAELPAPQNQSGDRSLSLLNYLLFTLVLASSILSIWAP